MIFETESKFFIENIIEQLNLTKIQPFQQFVENKFQEKYFMNKDQE